MKIPIISMLRISKHGHQKYMLILTGIGILMTFITLIFLQGYIFYQTLLIVSVLIAGLPFIIGQYLTYKRVKEIEENLPDFLRDVAESNRAGMPLASALKNATLGSYGALSHEMKIVSSQISWGIAFEESLMKFSRRIRSKLVSQAVTIIVESHRSGGNIADVLETVSTDIKTLKRIEHERKSKLKIYIISIYFIFLLFLGIIVTLTTTFVPATPELNKAAGILGGTASPLSEEDYKNLFFHLCLIQAFFAGIIGGQMGEGSIVAGFKHSVVLILITVIVFQIFIPTEPFTSKSADTILKILPSGSSVESSPTAFTIYESTTTTDISKLVVEKARNRGIPGYEEFEAGDITFSIADCEPCIRGDITVTDHSVIVHRPTKIIYHIIGQYGKYTIVISGT